MVGAHKGSRSIQVRSSLVNRQRPNRCSIAARASPAAPAASVHRRLWILCTTAAALRVLSAEPLLCCGSGHGPDRSQRTEEARGRAPALASVFAAGALPAQRALHDSFGPSHRPLEGDGLPHGGRSCTHVKARRTGRGRPGPLIGPFGRCCTGPEKPTFPIFNRKGGVCGRRISVFCTFSTPVDDPVDKHRVFPGNRRSICLDTRDPLSTFSSKGLDFPVFVFRRTCGKCPSLSLQWWRAFGTRHTHTGAGGQHQTNDRSPAFPATVCGHSGRDGNDVHHRHPGECDRHG
jgi:hypothetical protein